MVHGHGAWGMGHGALGMGHPEPAHLSVDLAHLPRVILHTLPAPLLAAGQGRAGHDRLCQGGQGRAAHQGKEQEQTSGMEGQSRGITCQ